MLAEVVIAGAMKLRRKSSGKISPSMISSCPMKTYKNWKRTSSPSEGLDYLRMNDGHYQETEMVDDLLRAGFQIKDRQLTVHIGSMVGHIDGLILVDKVWSLMDCKAMNLNRYTNFKQRGFEAESAIKIQMQLYLTSDELRKEGIDTGYVYTKHKDSCRPYDLYFEWDPSFAKSILDQVDTLLLGDIPKPIRRSLCSSSRDRLE